VRLVPYLGQSKIKPTTFARQVEGFCDMLVAVAQNSSVSRRHDLFPKHLDRRVSYVLNTQSSGYFGKSYLAHLSIKAASAGKGLYETDTGRFEANTTGYLVLNADQNNSLTVTSPVPAAGTIVFLSRHLLGDVYRSLTSKTNQLLDSPEAHRKYSIDFVERLYPHDTIVSPVMKRLRKSVIESFNSSGWFEDQLHHLAQQLLLAQRRICHAEMTLLPAARPATRYELYRRVYRARDYIIASMDQPLTVVEMARVACLSPSHFMRIFKQLFKVTPYQFLTEQRLLRAMELLADTDLSVTEITFMVGFESLGSFSWLFRRRLGISPLAFRSQKRTRRIVWAPHCLAKK
jgi:AraC family transcriptional regulator